MSDTVIKTIVICFTIISVFYMMTRVMIAENSTRKKPFEEDERNTDNDQ